MTFLQWDAGWAAQARWGASGGGRPGDPLVELCAEWKADCAQSCLGLSTSPAEVILCIQTTCMLPCSTVTFASFQAWLLMRAYDVNTEKWTISFHRYRAALSVTAVGAGVCAFEQQAFIGTLRPVRNSCRSARKLIMISCPVYRVLLRQSSKVQKENPPCSCSYGLYDLFLHVSPSHCQGLSQCSVIFQIKGASLEKTIDRIYPS